ncbi:MAG: glycosyltransferase, partial [Bdellovibrionales bacterium]|nr:glycosyltransferase [Bdellovibrionales bacterium]
MKKIAVFIPCYNVARRIRKFLQSFDQETLSKIDTLICVDNASEDSTLKIVKDVKSKSPILKNKL